MRLNIFKIVFVFAALAFAGTSTAQFATTGDATTIGCSKFELTPDIGAMKGSMNQIATVDLTSSFNLLFTVNFGCEDTGGEGMSFIMQTGAWGTGAGAFGLGYQGLSGNSISVEFDTRDNQTSGEVTNWDSNGDHISLMTNGSIDHSSTDCITGLPLDNISSTSANVEDCLDHLVEIIWTGGGTQTLEVKFDGVTRLTHTEDFINVRFGGVSNVLWGWAGSTGVFSNTQTVGVALEPDFSYSATACPGDLINFTDLTVAQNTITDWLWDFDGYGTSTLQNPSFTFTDAGNHPVKLVVTDAAGCQDSVTIEIGVGFVTDITTSAPIVCIGETADLEVTAEPFTGSDCCFQLVLGDLWDDGWAGNEVEVWVDGVLTGSYAPAASGMGGAYEETIDLCFDHDAVVELIISGDAFPFECYYNFLDAGGATLLSVAAGATWVDGHTETYTVDCGFTPPAYTFSWSPGGILSSTTVPNPTATLTTGTWIYVVVTNPDDGCVIGDSVFVDTHPPVDAVISGLETICDGATGDLTITLTGTPPFDIDVTGPSGPLPTITTSASPYTLSVGEDGIYTITAVTGDGCVGTFSGTGEIDVIIPPTVDIEADAAYCDGDPITDLTVVSGGGGTVNWYADAGLTGPPLFTGTTYSPTPGIGVTSYYAAETEGVLGCEGPADMVTITVNPIPPAPLFTGVLEYCEGEVPVPIVAEPALGGSITWYDGPPPATVVSPLLTYVPSTLTPGTVTYYITETAAGCEGPATPVPFVTKPRPAAPAVTGDDQYCEGDVFTALTATPGLGGDINWEDAVGTSLFTGTTYTPSPPPGSTDYYIYEELDGCVSDPTIFTIIVDPAPEVDVITEAEICLGDSVFVTAVHNDYPLTWSNGDTDESTWLVADTTTWFFIVATNPLCGFAEDSIQLIVNNLPIITAGNDTTMGIGGEVELWAESNIPVTFTWTPDVDECVEDDCSIIYDVPDQATVYVVVGTDANGCVSSDTVLVDIDGYMEVFVPNIFSPNADGHNDVLLVRGPRLYNFNIQIFDRWGKKVFETSDQKDNWDGTLNGKELAPQTFVYMLSGETVLGEQISKQGNVTIIK